MTPAPLSHANYCEARPIMSGSARTKVSVRLLPRVLRNLLKFRSETAPVEVRVMFTPLVPSGEEVMDSAVRRCHSPDFLDAHHRRTTSEYRGTLAIPPE